jgi:hypothetical protein
MRFFSVCFLFVGLALFVGCGSQPVYTDTKRCTAANCSGCCDSVYDRCWSGTEGHLCGISGTSCVDCPDKQGCNTSGMNIGRCSPCGPLNCVGCCDTLKGTCLPSTGGYQDKTSCGQNGQSCTVCATKCTGGVCT